MINRKKILVGISEGKRPHGGPRQKCEGDTEIPECVKLWTEFHFLWIWSNDELL
jgi:hypothetical protein